MRLSDRTEVTKSENYADSLSIDGRYRLLVEAITDYAIYMLDPTGRVANWNAGAQRFKGYTADEIIGTNFEVFYVDEDRQNGLPAQNLRRAREEGRIEQEGWRLRKDGTRFWAHVVIDRIMDPSGQLVGFAKITRDLTERRNTQAELEAAREALFQAQKMEAIGQLTGGIAHDFNNLLMAVQGSLETVMRRLPADNPHLPFIENALKGARRGTALTQRMLAFARRRELTMVAIDIGALVLGMRDMLERSLGPSILVGLRLPANAPKARSDPAQLENAILNLALNARDAMPNGGSITLSTAVRKASQGSEPRPSHYLVLAVEDDGEGMDEVTLSRATEPFFTTKEVGQGTGLGLAMVHGLAMQSGGRLHLESKKGQGTRAEIWLPLAEGQSEVMVEAEARAPHGGRALSILAVDDDPLVLINTVAMLEDLGHQVTSAGSAREALELIEGNRFDLVVSDQGMPHMTGLQMMDAMRLKGHLMPTIVTTGYASLPKTDVAVTTVSKPFGLDELETAIAETMVEPVH